MRGWKLIPDQEGYDEVELTQVGQVVTIGRKYCDIAITNEHTSVSKIYAVVKVVGLDHKERHSRHVWTARAVSVRQGTWLASRTLPERRVLRCAASQVGPTEPWRVVVVDKSKIGFHIDGQRVELDPDSGLRKRQLQLGQTISLSFVDDGVLSFKVGLSTASTAVAPQPPAPDESAAAAVAAAAAAKPTEASTPAAKQATPAAAEAIAPSCDKETA